MDYVNSRDIIGCLDILKNNSDQNCKVEDSSEFRNYDFEGFIIVKNLLSAPEIINIIAPEHLHLQNKNRSKIFKKIQNAGGVFLGEYSSEAYGDYIVGTNHVLPTCGSAAFSSGLNVLDFMKRSSYVKLSKSGSNSLGKHVLKMSSIENLDGHKLSVKIRQSSKN